jgi:predicted dehydrogenase
VRASQDPSTSHATQRVCIVGAGFGERFARAFHAESGAEVVAACARTIDSARRIVAATTGRPYVDVDEMLAKEAPSIVVVATPNYLHHPITMSALATGADVICEKPLALDVAQGQEMTSAAARLGRRSCTSFTWRFLPGCVALKALLDAGSIGTVYHADVRYVTRGLGAIDGPMRWQYDRAQAGSGAAANLGSHAIDLLHWWFGDMRRVAALTRTAIPHRATDTGGTAPVSVDDVCSGIYELSDGTPVTLNVGWVAHVARVELDVAIHASLGSARLRYASDAVDTHAGLLAYSDNAKRPYQICPTIEHSTEDWSDLGQACVNRLVSSFLGSVEHEPAMAPDFVDGLRAQCVLDATLAASRSDRWEAIRYPTVGRSRGAGVEGQKTQGPYA